MQISSAEVGGDRFLQRGIFWREAEFRLATHQVIAESYIEIAAEARQENERSAQGS